MNSGRRKHLIEHVITGLSVGGAERMLANIVGATSATVAHRVISLGAGGGMRDELLRAGAQLIELDVKAAGPTEFLKSAARLRGEDRPDVVAGWLHHGNVAAVFLANRWTAKPPIVMNFRGTLGGGDFERPILKTLRPLSHLANAVFANAHETLVELAANGFRPGTFLPNGFDTDKHRRNDAAGRVFRSRLGIPPGALLFGNLGRAHPMKNHQALLRAAADVLDSTEHAHVALAGRGVPEECADFVGCVGAKARRMHLLPEQPHPGEFFSALDFYVHASKSGEGFPNAICEAMLHELPIVATDVGETSAILGPSDHCVRRSDLPSLIGAVADFANRPQEWLRTIGRFNRHQIAARYDIRVVADSYARAFLRATERGPGRLSNVRSARNT